MVTGIPTDLVEPIDLPEQLPGKPGYQTILNWIKKGVTGPDGKNVKLRAYRIGAKRWVSLAAVSDFLAKLNAETATNG
ncbi:MAG TPA: DUF1580 domain-containing protein [Pirellulales bacterium]